MELALEILPQVLLDGIVLGFMYALIALGYTMVYGVLEFINFAHSEIFVLGAFVGVEILLMLQDSGQLANLHPAFVLLIVIIAGMVISGLAAMTLERVAYRPLQGSSRLVALISAIGASFSYKTRYVFSKVFGATRSILPIQRWIFSSKRCRCRPIWSCR